VASLPRPRYRSYSWLKDAACLTADPDLFFPPDGERGPSRDARDVMALAVCAACPVLEQCRRHALSARETYGIWGGTTEDERRSFHVRVRRARSHADRAAASSS
jgi:WhiB family redox-sensing transcriptional regulator